MGPFCEHDACPGKPIDRVLEARAITPFHRRAARAPMPVGLARWTTIDPPARPR